MTVVTTKTFHCDRCNIVLAAGPESKDFTLDLAGTSGIDLDAVFTEFEGREVKEYSWHILCESCQEIISMFFRPLKFQNARISEGNAGRKFFEHLLAQVDDPSLGRKRTYANSLMFRAMRMLGRKEGDKE